jgi:hypothetical protein
METEFLNIIWINFKLQRVTKNSCLNSRAKTLIIEMTLD